MSTQPSFENEELRVASLLRTLDAGIAPPDPEALARSRQATIDACLQASATAQAEPTQTVTEAAFRTDAPSPGRKTMTAILLRLVTAVVLAATSVALWLSGGASQSDVAFADVLDRVSDADTLHLEITQNGDRAEVWVQQPGRVRWEFEPTRYRIADGSRLWHIDEQSNTAQSIPAPWHPAANNSDGRWDLLSLLRVGTARRSQWMDARVTDRITDQGVACAVYESNLMGAIGTLNERQLHIEAVVEIETGRLRRMAIFDAQNALPHAAPLAEVRLLAMNQPIDESKFVVAKSLSEDGRIGKITDTQGIVTLRPALRERWTPVRRQTLLKPGDWLRVDLRGAHASQATLTSGVQITTGPGTLVEYGSPHQVHIHGGELQIALPEQLAKEFELLGPRGQKVRFDAAKAVAKEQGRRVFRITSEEKLVELPTQPQWLAAFEGTVAGQPIGSLIVNIDGRNEPLTVGYHNVTVEIRDQIARTTIEESFVNRTLSRLEGVFHFPLPQDASISGFGMWIGENLVEADIVEKQRAREIYETILRERRDPGLLEWTAGNLFKARVFPIEPHSEKRIKIVYTQVLPLRGNRYRYNYALQSELLRQHPLRELSLNVTVNSALPLRNIECPTHDARIAGPKSSDGKTAHAARVEFSAQEYTPTRDFEVVCEVDGAQNDVVVVPHRRGDDGYFLMQLTPPAAPGDWQRELLPDGQPLELLLLCDTSGSMDEDKRRQQAAFVSAVLSSLGPKDRFNLAGCDVDSVWAFGDFVASREPDVVAAKQFLMNRRSMGWTDLDKAFASVMQRCSEATHVVYIGDGIVTAGKADGQEFVNRLNRLFDDRRQGTFHAVNVGNISDSVVLKAIAGLGGGSVRSISGERTPQSVAFELLNEIAQPGLKDIRVEFRGLQVAAVYPSKLPNAPSGSQQILLGRYLPQGKDQAGEAIVTARRGNETVKFVATVSLKDAEQGNSFIPRLWARMHLDYLLAQGSNDFIKSEIIRLSEEFHIITPYTSLLVLETDADRERFGVKRRYQMRDGERFFAEGRDNAQFELLQKHMQQAGDWRLNLRRTILQQLSGLGRDPRLVQAIQQRMQFGEDWNRPMGRSSGLGGGGGFAGSAPMGGPGGPFVDEFSDFAPFERSLGGVLGRGAFAGAAEDARVDPSLSALGDVSGLPMPDGSFAGDSLELLSDFEESEDLLAAEPARRKLSLSERDESWLGQGPVGSRSGRFPSLAAKPFGANAPFAGFASRIGGAYKREYPGLGHGWFDRVFPILSLPPSAQRRVQTPAADWPAEAIQLSKSLLRAESLQRFNGGIEVRRKISSRDPQWNRETGGNEVLELYSSAGWLTRPTDTGSHVVVNWCDEQERGVFSGSIGLGRVRKSEPAELMQPPLALSDYSLSALHETYLGYLAAVEPAGVNRTSLLLTSAHDPDNRVRILIDTARHVILKIEAFANDKLQSTTEFADFVAMAGRKWATRRTVTDAQGRMTAAESQTITAHEPAAYRERLQTELSSRRSVQFARLPVPTVIDAKQAVADGDATFEARLVVLAHFAASQQWDKVFEQLEAVEKAAAQRLDVDGLEPAQRNRGLRWLRIAVLKLAGRNEDARQKLIAEAERLVAGKATDELFLADFILSDAYGVSDWNEYLRMIELLKPLYDRQPERLGAKWRWEAQRLNSLGALGRREERLAGLRQLLTETPWDTNLHSEYARELAAAGNHAAAYRWLQQELERDVWREHEYEQLRSTHVTLLRGQARFADLIEFWEQELIRRKPTYVSESHYSQYLSALVMADQEDRAKEMMREWIAAARVDGKLDPQQLAELTASISLALGQGHELYSNRIADGWLEPLADVARFFARHPHHFSIAARIIGHQQFQDSDEIRRLRVEWLVLLKTDAGKLTPDHMHSLISWILPDDPPISDVDWRSIATVLRERWNAEPDQEKRNQLGGALVAIYSQRFANSEWLPFLREQIAAGPEKYREQYRQQLFEALLSRPWSDPIEREAFELVGKLGPENDDGPRRAIQVSALLRWVDRMLEARSEASLQALKAAGRPEDLTRTQYAQKTAEFRRQAREGVAARLGELVPRHDGPLGGWIQMERSYLDVLLNREFERVAAACWTILGDAAPAIQTDEGMPPLGPTTVLRADSDRQQIESLQNILRHRALTTVMNVSARQTADPKTVSRLQRYLESGMAHGGDSSWAWKYAKFQLLIALDRPDELERELSAWIQTDSIAAPWRLALGRLQAERGKLAEAVAQFEAVERKDQLGPADYRALADWYLALNRRGDHDRATVAAWKVMQEWQISQYLSRMLQPWQRNDAHLPSQLDENVLHAFQALFEKSAQPGQYLWQLQSFYSACRDFRLLQMVPDSVLHKSVQQIYSFLGGLSSTVLNELREEATADEIISRIGVQRESATAATDLRALDLLEALVERRSSEVLNQPGPHVDAALAALQRAFRREWADGEQRQMADFLAGLGHISQAKLADEQLRELTELHSRQKPGSDDRLFIAAALARCLAAHGRLEQGIAVAEIAVREFRETHADGWPAHANSPLSTYVSLLGDARRFAAAETFLQQQLARPANESQREVLNGELAGVYVRALRDDGQVSLGSRETLFRKLLMHLLEHAPAASDHQRYQLINRVLEVFRIAHEKKIPTLRADLRAFAFQQLPELLKAQRDYYESMVSQTGETLRLLLSPRDGLEFLIERMEHYPRRFEYQWNSPWNQHGYRLAQWRKEVVTLGNLEPRLLKLVLAELQRDLRSRVRGNRYFYEQHSGYFWPEKADDFARTAEEVLAERKESGRTIVYVAQYLWSGLGRNSRAIDVLFDGHRRALINEQGVQLLVDVLHDSQRFGESIALLEPLAEKHPDVLRHRTELMLAYARTNRRKQLQTLLKSTDSHFRAGERWNEDVAASLGASCLRTDLPEQSADYYQAAIAMRLRSSPLGGRNDETLSGYYQQQSTAYSHLGRTQEAVDAASAAIVTWAAQHQRRQGALESLAAVLRSAVDRDQYAVWLNMQVEVQGQDRPIIRKQLGRVYRERKEHEKAVVQLELAAELVPQDKEVQQWLLESYDALGRSDQAIAQLLAMIDRNPRDLALHQSLAKRLADDESQAERAATSMVEALPTETESHAALAEVREQQNRWDDAILHWRQVAELRALEPTGLLRLAAAQIHQQQLSAAEESLDKLSKTSWPSRFSNVKGETDQLRARLRTARAQ